MPGAVAPFAPPLHATACHTPDTPLRSTLSNLSLVMKFLGNFFSDFIFEKLISHEALVIGRVTAASNKQTQLLK